MVANIPVAPNVRLTSDFNIRSAMGKFLNSFYFGHITAIAKIYERLFWPICIKYNILGKYHFISTECASRRPLTYDDHPIPSNHPTRVKVPKRMNFRKSSKEGEGVIFNPKIYIADFWNFRQGFLSVKSKHLKGQL